MGSDLVGQDRTWLEGIGWGRKGRDGVGRDRKGSDGVGRGPVHVDAGSVKGYESGGPAAATAVAGQDRTSLREGGTGYGAWLDGRMGE